MPRPAEIALTQPRATTSDVDPIQVTCFFSFGTDGRDVGGAPVADVFISYRKTNRDAAEFVSAALGAAGVTYWFDREIEPDENWRKRIKTELQNARCVLVIWSVEAVESEFVIDESSRAKSAGKLVQVRIDNVEPPLGFGELQAHDLIGWRGDAADPRWQGVLTSVQRVLQGLPASARDSESFSVAKNTRAQNAWQQIVSSTNPAEYKFFLERYGDSPLARLANEHLDDLIAWAQVNHDDPDAVRKFILTGPYAGLANAANQRIQEILDTQQKEISRQADQAEWKRRRARERSDAVSEWFGKLVKFMVNRTLEAILIIPVLIDWQLALLLLVPIFLFVLLPIMIVRHIINREIYIDFPDELSEFLRDFWWALPVRLVAASITVYVFGPELLARTV